MAYVKPMDSPHSKDTFLVILPNILFDEVVHSPEIGYDDQPPPKVGDMIVTIDLEACSRVFLELLRKGCEDGEAFDPPPNMTKGESREWKTATPREQVIQKISALLDRTPEQVCASYVHSVAAFFQLARYIKDLCCRFDVAGFSFVLPVEFELSGAYCFLSAKPWMHDVRLDLFKLIDESFFGGGSMLMVDAFKKAGAPIASPEEVEEGRLQIQTSQEFQAKSGCVVDVIHNVLRPVTNIWYTKAEPINIGATPEAPRRLIVEGDLEVTEKLSDRGANLLPLVRCFSPDNKSYVYAHVKTLVPHTFDRRAKDAVVLPIDTRGVLDKIFGVSQGNVFGDIFRHRHGGVIILAAGNPGVGKTVTAEAFAESAQRPLYVLGVGELGTSAEAVEKSLALVFQRVRAWNAILLLDEGDIFLTKRTEGDLERSAIVGVFLRVLDQYQGILFITTNRPDVLDPALLSRVTVKFAYPDFDPKARAKVWSHLLTCAGISISNEDLAQISELPLHGRAIRNLVRILGICGNGSLTSTEEIEGLMKFIPG